MFVCMRETIFTGMHKYEIPSVCALVKSVQSSMVQCMRICAYTSGSREQQVELLGVKINGWEASRDDLKIYIYIGPTVLLRL